MNLSHLQSLRDRIALTADLNSLRNELIEEFERIVHFLKDQVEKDVRHLELDVLELKKTTVKSKKALEIIGHLVMDFGELRKDLETEI